MRTDPTKCGLAIVGPLASIKGVANLVRSRADFGQCEQIFYDFNDF